MDIKDKLREICNVLRTKPVALSEFIPLLQKAADYIEELEFELKEERNE